MAAATDMTRAYHIVTTESPSTGSITCHLHDTLIISKSIYRQLIVVLDDELMRKKREDFLLYYKAILLKEVSVISLNPTYEGFKRDLAKIEIPEIYQKIPGVEMTAEDKANAEYDKGPNVFRNTAIAHPISYVPSDPVIAIHSTIYRQFQENNHLLFSLSGLLTTVCQDPYI